MEFLTASLWAGEVEVGFLERLEERLVLAAATTVREAAIAATMEEEKGLERNGIGEERRGEEEGDQLTANNKVKFLCSHDDKILPRPANGHLMYVGSETRVFSVRCSIGFSGA
ncbi:hypothetical protein CRG98_030285 [Punica granatum]|uniref:Uncharacterized protein n=1 Tax=Punica granatum TaxID=22663 RepID=A0A2I0IZC5_PUNGR|nr:hypothetical protein CRG98_030285 [Punica granatum]